MSIIQPTPQPDLFGPMLRAWRRRRGASQLALALQSGVSQRHVSFLESGRARPSREMVVQLTSALDVPLRQRNSMLLAAGFAPVYRESNLAAPELAPVRQAIERMLKQQEPYPAVVIDRLWNSHIAAWYEGGRTDPKLALLRFDAASAEIWLNGSSLVAGIKTLFGADPKEDYKENVAEVAL